MTMLAVQSFLLILAAFLGGAMLACFLRRVFFVRDNEHPSPQGGTRVHSQSDLPDKDTVEVLKTESRTTVTSEEQSRFGRALTGPGEGTATGIAATVSGTADRSEVTADAATKEETLTPAAMPMEQDEVAAIAPPPIASEPEAMPADATVSEPNTPEQDTEIAAEPTPAPEVPPMRPHDPALVAAAVAAAQDMMRRTYPGEQDAKTRTALADRGSFTTDEDDSHAANDQIDQDAKSEAIHTSSPDLPITTSDEGGIEDGDQSPGQDDADTEIAAASEPVITHTASTETPRPQAIEVEQVQAGAGESAREAVATAAPVQDAPDQSASSDVRALHSVRSEALVGREPTQPGSSSNVFAMPTGRRAGIDDLKQIRGIGVLIEKKLNAMGIRNYEQIANWTADDVRKVSETLDFKGRIERESWIEQARILSSGGTTDFSRRA